MALSLEYARLVGASFTAATESVKLCKSESGGEAPSLNETVTVVEPEALATGFIDSTQAGTAPEKLIPAPASTAVLLEVPASEPAHVRVLSTSLTESVIDVAVSSSVVWGAIGASVGASLTAETMYVT